MLGAGARRGAAGLARGVLSRRVLNHQRRSMAMAMCLAHKVSLANIAPSSSLVSGKLGCQGKTVSVGRDWARVYGPESLGNQKCL